MGDPVTTVTDGTGFYEFIDLTPGVEYKVMFVQPDGFDGVSPFQEGNDPTVDSDANPDEELTSDGVVLAPDENNPTIDAGFFKTAGIGDFVFEDLDADGIQDLGEAGIPNAEVKLLDENGDPVLDENGDPITTTTDATGFYEFTGLTPGDYKVMFVQPDGFSRVSPFQEGDDPTVDSDANPEDGLMSDVVNLESGEFDETIDAGFFKPAEIGDFVFDDLDQDGIQDLGEPGIPDAIVKLLDGNGDPVLDENGDPVTTTTDDTGFYEFTDLTPGDYKIMFVQPDGFEGVSPFQEGDDPTVDSDANPDDGLMSDVVNLESGEVDDTIDAGFFDIPGASLGDFVFEDTDADGIQDIGEEGIPDAIVKLLDGNGDPILDENGDPVTTVTDGTGFYEFIDLTPGVEYKVMFVQPDGFDGVSPFQEGNDPTVDSDANPDEELTSDGVVLAPDENNPTIDAGFFKTAGIGDFVFEDLDADGIQDLGEAGIPNAEVKLLDENGDPVLDENGDPITTTTDATGFYEFTGLTPGDYKVMFVQPDGFSRVSPFQEGDDPTVDSDANPEDGLMSDVVNLESGEFDETIDAGFFKPAEIGDFVFDDLDQDGIQDLGEPGIPDAIVKLLDGNGDPVLDEDDNPITTTTDATGFYEFTDLTPGDYKIMFVQPDGFEGVSPFQEGDDPTVDSDANPDDGLMSDVVNLESGEVDDTIDAGFFDIPGASLGDFVFEDTDADGIQDIGEEGIPDAIVKLLDGNGDPILDENGDPVTTVTDGTGLL